MILEHIHIKNINKHYWNRYVKFITNIHKKGRRNLQYTERHHIIPKCLDISLCDNIDNIIILTPREHYIAHKLLSYCFLKDTEEYNKLVFALFAMSKLKMSYHNRDDLISSREYQILRIRYSEARKCYMKKHITDSKYDKLLGKGKPSYNKGMIGITNGVLNTYINKNDTIPNGWYRGSTQKPKDDNWRLSLKESWSHNKQNRVGENHPMYGKGYLLKGRQPGNKGMIGIMKDGKSMYVNKSDLDEYIQNGWLKGICKSNKIKGCCMYINKNDVVKLIDRTDLQTYLQDGWTVGNPKASNKGEANRFLWKGMYEQWCNK